MKIAVLYIATGRYSIFWPGFLASAERYLVPATAKDYFIFTDRPKEFSVALDRIIFTQIEDAPWPFPSLFRFDYFEQQAARLVNYDLIVFCNANLIFVDEIAVEEILPTPNEGLFVTLHPGYFRASRRLFPYECIQQASAAFIPAETGSIYVCDGFFGGRPDAFLELTETLSRNIRADFERGITAMWHDESHLNHYILGGVPRVLSPKFAWPSGWIRFSPPKIVVLNKRDFGGHEFMRAATNEPAHSGDLVKVFELMREPWRLVALALNFMKCMRRFPSCRIGQDGP